LYSQQLATQTAGDVIPAGAIPALISALVANYQSIMACLKYSRKQTAETDRLQGLAKTMFINDTLIRVTAATVDVIR